MTDEETIRRGIRAADILADPLVEEALASLRDRVIHGWCVTSLGAREERETFYYLHCAVEEFAAHFRSLVTDGKFAENRSEQAKREKAAG